MYHTIYKTLDNSLKNYNKRPSLKSIVTKEELYLANTYTKYWSENEACYETCYKQLTQLNIELAKHLEGVHQWGIEIDIDKSFAKMVCELAKIDEELTREEAENLGFGPNSKRLRKEWRQIIRKCHKYLNKSVKNKIRYIKEWSKPRQVYILSMTGECHNGLYWTLRELIIHPTYIKYGFEKED